METRYVPLSQWDNYKVGERGKWIHRIAGTNDWVPTYCDIEFETEEESKESLPKRTVEAIEALLKIAPETNCSANDGWTVDDWASSDWADALTLLHEIVGEWKVTA